MEPGSPAAMDALTESKQVIDYLIDGLTALQEKWRVARFLFTGLCICEQIILAWRSVQLNTSLLCCIHSFISQMSTFGFYLYPNYIPMIISFHIIS